MEIVKYICEFFFCNFWHWLLLWILIHTRFGVTFKEREKKDDKEE